MDVAAHAPQAGSPRRTHPIVALDYRVRTWANLLVAAVMLSAFLERETPAWVWALVVFQGLLWAPLARQLACRADDSRPAEHRNLMADAVLYGVLSGLVAFQLWPTTMMLTAILLSILSLGGLN